jgi:hypothetical protein
MESVGGVLRCELATTYRTYLIEKKKQFLQSSGQLWQQDMWTHLKSNHPEITASMFHSDVNRMVMFMFCILLIADQVPAFVECNFARYYEVLMKLHTTLLESEAVVLSLIMKMLSNDYFFCQMQQHVKNAVYFSVLDIPGQVQGRQCFCIHNDNLQ